MKKATAIIISLCLVFCSVLPVYAAFDSSDSQNLSTINTNVTALLRVFTGSVGTMYNSVSEMMSWLTPAGSFSNSHSITGVTLYEIVDYIAWTLSGVGPTVYQTLQNTCSSIINSESLISAFKTQNNSNFQSLLLGLTNYYAATINGTTWNWQTWRLNAHQHLSNTAASDVDNYSRYNIPVISGLGSYTNFQSRWDYGSPIGNIALMLQKHMINDVTKYNITSEATLTHYNDTLSTWDSQQNTLTQVNFTPESAIQGLYRYLAFTQRDVARLAYVLASDEEIEVREKARANQTEVLDDFVDPTGDGAVSASDFSSVSSASAEFKDNFNTGASASGVWSVFDQSYVWFSQTTADNLTPTVQQNNRSLKSSLGDSDYDLSYLENQYNEIFSIIEGFNND